MVTHRGTDGDGEMDITTTRSTKRALWAASGLSLLVLIGAACSGGNGDADPVRTTPLATGVEDTSQATTDSSVAAPTTGPPTTTTLPAGTVSFRNDVMPVVEQNCATCHNPGAVGSHEWELATAADVVDAGEDIDLFTSTRYMPPWPASRVGVPLAHNRSLTNAEIKSITKWLRQGSVLDVEPDAPIEPPVGSVEPFDADIELTLAEPYQGSTDQRNDYRCFLIDPKLAQTTWVTGYEFEADVPEVVHHALAFHVADPAQLADLQVRDAADPDSGWSCSAGGITQGQFMAWAPGQDPIRLRDGVGLRMEPGDQLMLQIHYHYDHRAKPDQSRFLMSVAEPGEDVVDLMYRTYLAPAEIPCRPGIEEGPLCDRAAVVEELVADYGPFGALISDALAASCGKSREELAVLVDGVASSSCDYVIGDDTEALAVFGHMHEVGSTFRMTLNKGTDHEVVMLDIPNWNFDWQLNYEFEKPVDLSVGDVLSVECTWDRNRLDPPLPRYITWAEGTEDEMCYSALTLIPRPTD